MSNASTRAHVPDLIAASLIPAANPDPKNRKTRTPEDSDSEEALQPAIPQSRKEKRREKKQTHDSALPTPSSTDNEASTPPRKPPNKPPKKRQKPNIDHATTLFPSMPLAKDALQKAYPLLICSIGNPGATYANTLHSAGHVVTSYLSERKSYKPFTKGLSGLVSRPDNTAMSFSIIRGYRRVEGDAPPPEEDWTFWQSTTLMNISGGGVKKAYNEWLRSVKAQSGSSATEGRLVVVHDELEGALGKVTVRDGAASAKGHNGLKSCQQQLGGIKWWRISIGIGRPESRDPNVVSKYVLGKISGSQRAALEKSAVAVYGALEQIAAGRK
ncbi:peptidyl-tRNA hydrolase [Cucurbitaria berberidis CBS 394.84]|uniref:peptidyl-tRNA hydrolase n=1 Tax=Cucurbitaria berberidis CBS 394.84 TaxID=1168544 RepID=A0A9P4GSI1_9PLEO|nr:peptidyl-tRNA hydrolase [Cucurbitaria berberidis CBS 394.84]KAF1850935.1 peptidyl-tRNA hydrolase [Cucurbitaria berberidis CBS 394.84]